MSAGSGSGAIGYQGGSSVSGGKTGGYWDYSGWHASGTGTGAYGVGELKGTLSQGNILGPSWSQANFLAAGAIPVGSVQANKSAVPLSLARQDTSYGALAQTSLLSQRNLMSPVSTAPKGSIASGIQSGNLGMSSWGKGVLVGKQPSASAVKEIAEKPSTVFTPTTTPYISSGMGTPTIFVPVSGVARYNAIGAPTTKNWLQGIGEGIKNWWGQTVPGRVIGGDTGEPMQAGLLYQAYQSVVGNQKSTPMTTPFVSKTAPATIEPTGKTGQVTPSTESLSVVVGKGWADPNVATQLRTQGYTEKAFQVQYEAKSASDPLFSKAVEAVLAGKGDTVITTVTTKFGSQPVTAADYIAVDSDIRDYGGVELTAFGKAIFGSKGVGNYGAQTPSVGKGAGFSPTQLTDFSLAQVMGLEPGGALAAASKAEQVAMLRGIGFTPSVGINAAFASDFGANSYGITAPQGSPAWRDELRKLAPQIQIFRVPLTGEIDPEISLAQTFPLLTPEERGIIGTVSKGGQIVAGGDYGENITVRWLGEQVKKAELAGDKELADALNKAIDQEMQLAYTYESGWRDQNGNFYTDENGNIITRAAGSDYGDWLANHVQSFQPIEANKIWQNKLSTLNDPYYNAVINTPIGIEPIGKGSVAVTGTKWSTPLGGEYGWGTPKGMTWVEWQQTHGYPEARQLSDLEAAGKVPLVAPKYSLLPTGWGVTNPDYVPTGVILPVVAPTEKTPSAEQGKITPATTPTQPIIALTNVGVAGNNVTWKTDKESAGMIMVCGSHGCTYTGLEKTSGKNHSVSLDEVKWLDEGKYYNIEPGEIYHITISSTDKNDMQEMVEGSLVVDAKGNVSYQPIKADGLIYTKQETINAPILAATRVYSLSDSKGVMNKDANTMPVNQVLQLKYNSKSDTVTVLVPQLEMSTIRNQWITNPTVTKSRTLVYEVDPSGNFRIGQLDENGNITSANPSVWRSVDSEIANFGGNEVLSILSQAKQYALTSRPSGTSVTSYERGEVPPNDTWGIQKPAQGSG